MKEDSEENEEEDKKDEDKKEEDETTVSLDSFKSNSDSNDNLTPKQLNAKHGGKTSRGKTLTGAKKKFEKNVE